MKKLIAIILTIATVCNITFTNPINADYQNSKEYGVVIKCKKDNFDFIECMTWPQDYKDENAKRTKKAG